MESVDTEVIELCLLLLPMEVVEALETSLFVAIGGWKYWFPILGISEVGLIAGNGGGVAKAESGKLRAPSNVFGEIVSDVGMVISGKPGLGNSSA